MNNKHPGRHLGDTSVDTWVDTCLREGDTLDTSRVFNSLIIKNRYYHVLTNANACEYPQSHQSVTQLKKSVHATSHKLSTKAYLLVCLGRLVSIFDSSVFISIVNSSTPHLGVYVKSINPEQKNHVSI